LHLLLEGGVGGVLDRLHADGESGFDVFEFVIEEEDVCRCGVEAFGGVEVDGGLGFGKVQVVGPGVVGEFVDPAIAGAEAGLHGAGHVGEDAGGEASLLKGVRPGEHRRIEGGPVIDVCGDESGKLLGGEDSVGGRSGVVPEGFGGEVASVVGVAMRPVARVELFFAESGDGEHAGPGGGIGWAGEDHAVVEEDCFYWSHG